MKFIARKDFYRVPALAALAIIGGCKGAADFDTENGKSSVHDNHIHIGAIFELGSSQTEAELEKGKDPQRQLIAQLRVAGCISNAADKEEVTAIEIAIATEKKRLATVEARSGNVAKDEAADKLIALLERLLAQRADPKQTEPPKK
jgi:hypothetical protein